MAETFARRLRERRKLLGLSQDDLANAIGATQAAISRYEVGNTSPSAEAISGLAQVLKTSTDWLLGLTNNVDVIPPAVDLDLSPTEFEIVELVRAFPQEKHQALLDLLQAVRRLGL